MFSKLKTPQLQLIPHVLRFSIKLTKREMVRMPVRHDGPSVLRRTLICNCFNEIFLEIAGELER